ncbi:hypothetical protein AwDysgo_06010 [Bacteroidales bacterium]|nr:hypothetical protein AwDysgo_06010 [Bacteroidales bacterium]
MVKKRRRFVAVLWITLFVSACCQEDFFDSKTDYLLHISVLNFWGENITTDGDAGDVNLFVFDQDYLYRDKLSISSESIKKDSAIRLTYNKTSNIWLITWSNLNGSQDLILKQAESFMQDASIKLKRDNEGYAINPDDLFYAKNIISSPGSATEVAVSLKRKTAKIRIAVKGLTQANDYYFIIDGCKEDAYSFDGESVGDSIKYRQYGVFNSDKSLFQTPDAFRIFPPSKGNKNSIALYKGTELIVLVDKTNEASEIVPQAGATTNILIDLTKEDGILGINVIVTSWDDYYEWVEW